MVGIVFEATWLFISTYCYLRHCTEVKRILGVSFTSTLETERRMVMSPRGGGDAACDIMVGTRLHLGNATAAPPDQVWIEKLESFENFCFESCAGPGTVQGVIAVDDTDRISGYSLVETIQRLVGELASSHDGTHSKLQILPVRPWGKFVPALNALVGHAVSACRARHVMFVSAEMSVPKEAVQKLLSATRDHYGSVDDDVLVVGARLAGHDYHAQQADGAGVVVSLGGRTSPWNTLAVWNLRTLALTGFQLVSDALIPDDDKNKEPWYAGIEEVVAIALLQKLLGADRAKAKLMHIPGIEWDQNFDDPERKRWHEYKMESKATRGAHQLALTRLEGEVIHC
jgi:hypothetical protein